MGTNQYDGNAFDPHVIYDGKPSTENQGYNRSFIFVILIIIIILFIYFYKTIR